MKTRSILNLCANFHIERVLTVGESDYSYLEGPITGIYRSSGWENTFKIVSSESAFREDHFDMQHDPVARISKNV